MALQEIIKEKIENFGGIKFFNDEIEKIKKLVPKKDHWMIDISDGYYSLMYVIELNLSKKPLNINQHTIIQYFF